MKTVLAIIAILIGLQNSKVIVVPDSNMVVFITQTIEELEVPMLAIVDNQMRVVGTIKISDVLWVRYIPDDKTS